MKRLTLLVCVVVYSIQFTSINGHFKPIDFGSLSPLKPPPDINGNFFDIAVAKMMSIKLIAMMTYLSSHPDQLCIISPSIIVKLLTQIACNPNLFNSIPHHVLSGFMFAMKISPDLVQAIPPTILQSIYTSISSVASLTPPVLTLPPPVAPSLPSVLPPPVAPSLPSVLPPPVAPSLPSVLPPPVAPSLPSVLPPPVAPSLPSVLPPPVAPSLPSVLPPPVVPSIPSVIPSPVAPSIPSVLPPPVAPSIPSVLPPPVAPSIPSVLPPPVAPTLPPLLPPPVVSSLPSVIPPPVVPSLPMAEVPLVSPMIPPAVFPTSPLLQAPGFSGILCPTSLIPILRPKKINLKLPLLPKINPCKHQVKKPILNKIPILNIPELPTRPKISLIPKIVFPPTQSPVSDPPSTINIVPNTTPPPKIIPCKHEVQKPLPNIIPWASKTLESIIKCLLEVAPKAIVFPQISKPFDIKNHNKEKPIVTVTPNDISKIFILLPSTTYAHNPSPPTSVGPSPTAPNTYYEFDKTNQIQEKLENLKNIINLNPETGPLKTILKKPFHSKVPC